MSESQKPNSEVQPKPRRCCFSAEYKRHRALTDDISVQAFAFVLPACARASYLDMLVKTQPI